MKPINEMNLQECLGSIRKGNYLGRYELTDRIVELTRWISVEERLPTIEDADESGKVLIYRITTKAQRSSAKGLFDWSMVRACEPSETWWMPLPKAPVTPPEGV